ncbi:MAG: glucose 1-dehydrogenase [Oligoflexia bacterium]|nr:glucose 1-dehydrogenase [Oligoflexia bacterium]
MKNISLKGKVAIVTGGSMGIGKAAALAFARQGAQVCVADWEPTKGEETVKEIIANDGRAFFQKVDVSSESQVREMVQATLSKYGRLDFAFNNAGIAGDQKPTGDNSVDNWNKVIGVNLTGVWLCMKEEIPHMLKQGGGVIINNASILGSVGFAGASAYTASKHGVIGLTQVAAIEYGPKNLRVNAVCPGFIVTPMLERAGLLADPAVVQNISNLHALKRMGKPEEVADTVVWLCSEEASFITGQPIFVDGGYTAQ